MYRNGKQIWCISYCDTRESIVRKGLAEIIIGYEKYS